MKRRTKGKREREKKGDNNNSTSQRISKKEKKQSGDEMRYAKVGRILIVEKENIYIIHKPGKQRGNSEEKPKE